MKIPKTHCLWALSCLPLVLAGAPASQVRAQTPTAAFTTLQSFHQKSDGLEVVAPLVEGADGNYYGTTYRGGSQDVGVVFQVTPGGTQTIFYDFANDPVGLCPISGLVLASDGVFYGTTSNDGGEVSATFFALTSTGVLTTLYTFDPATGDQPGTLTEGADHNLYGLCNQGGANGDGSIVQLTRGGGVTLLHSFTGGDGAAPVSPLCKGSDNNFYGVTPSGGANGDGVVFSISPTGTYTVLHTFSGTDGSAPDGKLVEVSPGVFLGMTQAGGTFGQGTLFQVSSAQAFSTLHNFNLSSENIGTPFGGLTLAGDGNYYGMTRAGGTNNGGVIFSATSTGGSVSIAHNFGATNSQLSFDGVESEAGLTASGDGNLYGVTQLGGVNSQGSTFSLTTGGVYTTLHSFLTTGNSTPLGALVRDASGNFFGTTLFGGTANFGTIFELTAQGTLLTLHNFNGPDGEAPYGAPTLTSDGTLYGTTGDGGANLGGTVYKFTTDHTLTTLHSFADSGNVLSTETEGVEPQGSLVADGGNFLGATSSGTTNDTGTLFEITPAGSFTLLHTFLTTEGTATGNALFLGSNANFYGAAKRGGGSSPYSGSGTIYTANSSGGVTVLYRFSARDANNENSDGYRPNSLIQGAGNLLYGAAEEGGANAGGTLFALTTGGAYSLLYTFSAVNPANSTNSDGQGPHGLTLGSDGNIYGVASTGGASGNGTIFVLTPAAAFTVLHTFSASDSNGINADGALPYASLVETSNGTFYGSTEDGGAGGVGTIFTFTVSPAITSALTAPAEVGQAFSYQIAATNSASSFAAGSLPPGLTINTTTGLISGTPSQAGSFPVALSATNAGGAGTGTLTLTVAPAPPVITSALTATVQAGQPFTYQIAATNSPTSYAAAGLPAGLSVDATGLIAGTPTIVGNYPVTLAATNATATGVATLALTVTPIPVPAPAITSAGTAGAQDAVAFSYQITATNSPTSYAATGLPTGLTVDPATGAISGTPTATAGAYTVALAATNAGGTGTATLSLNVAPPAVTLTATTPQVVAGSGTIGEFTLTLAQAQAQDVIVNLTIKGTAVNGSDYLLLKTTKKIKAGHVSKPIKVTPLGNGAGPGVKRTVVLVLGPGNGYTVGTTGKVKVKIIGQ